jgi:hypothetical protein
VNPLTTPPTDRENPRPLVDIVEEGGDDTPSITEVNGTVARFAMAYPAEVGQRFNFGPPLLTRIPSYVYVAFSLVLVGLVIAAHNGSHNSRLYIWIVEGDAGRPLSAGILSYIVFASAIATVIRTHMRGVIVGPDGIETRSILAFGIPRIKRLAWAQVDRVVIDTKKTRGGIMLELWDNTYERLPAVEESTKLAGVLETVAIARKIRVTRL